MILSALIDRFRALRDRATGQLSAIDIIPLSHDWSRSEPAADAMVTAIRQTYEREHEASAVVDVPVPAPIALVPDGRPRLKLPSTGMIPALHFDGRIYLGGFRILIEAQDNQVLKDILGAALDEIQHCRIAHKHLP